MERDGGDTSAAETHRRAALAGLGIALSAMENPIGATGETGDGSRASGATANATAAPPLPPHEPATGRAEAPVDPRARRRPERAAMPAAPAWLPQELWDRWQAHRRALKKPLSPDAARLSLARLEKAKGFGHDPVELLETAIASGWQGCVFADQHYQPPARSPAAERAGGRRPLRAGPADPAAYRETGGFAVELALEEG